MSAEHIYRDLSTRKNTNLFSPRLQMACICSAIGSSLSFNWDVSSWDNLVIWLDDGWNVSFVCFLHILLSSSSSILIVHYILARLDSVIFVSVKRIWRETAAFSIFYATDTFHWRSWTPNATRKTRFVNMSCQTWLLRRHCNITKARYYFFNVMHCIPYFNAS